jgi:hypothetical protein
MSLRNEQTSSGKGNQNIVNLKKRWYKKQATRWRRRFNKEETPPKKYRGWAW